MDTTIRYQELKHLLDSIIRKIPGNKVPLSGLEDFERLLADTLNDLSAGCDQYKMLYENAGNSICVHTESGRILSANTAACTAYQYTPEVFMNMNIAQIEASGRIDTEKLQEVMRSGSVNFETSHVRRDGTIRFMDVTCKRITWNGEPAILSICHDITDHKSAEKALRESELKFREIISQTNDGIVVFDEDKQIVIWNKGAETLFGLSAKEILNTSIVDLQFKHAPSGYKDRDLITKTINAIINFENPDIFYKIRDEEIVIPGFEETIKIETVLFPIKIDDHYLFGGIMRDITEKKKFEDQLLQMNANKDRFMQVLAHDLRSPFNALLGFSELLLENLHEYDIDVIEYQLNIQRGIIQKTFFLLEDMLLWSKSQLGMLDIRPSIIAFDELCQEIIDSLKTTAVTKKISLSYSGELNAYITADPYMMKTVIRNLLSNALKFTDRGGIIKIETQKDGDNLSVTVSDNGVGISEENQKKLWRLDTPFSTKGTNDEQGTGLGLLICKDFVEQHGGRISVESKEGQGSEFRLSLPVDPEIAVSGRHGKASE
jgi:PAS domain S-box-containing protein